MVSDAAGRAENSACSQVDAHVCGWGFLARAYTYAAVVCCCTLCKRGHEKDKRGGLRRSTSEKGRCAVQQTKHGQLTGSVEFQDNRNKRNQRCLSSKLSEELFVNQKDTYPPSFQRFHLV